MYHAKRGYSTQSCRVTKCWRVKERRYKTNNLPDLFLLQTPLHLAIQDNSVEIVDILLAFGADPGVQDRRGNTSFHTAIANKSLDILKLLVKNLRSKDCLNRLNEFGKFLFSKVEIDLSLEKVVKFVVCFRYYPTAHCHHQWGHFVGCRPHQIRGKPLNTSKLWIYAVWGVDEDKNW